MTATEQQPDWDALRQAHFYISDLFFRDAEPMGIGVAERRLADALGFARQRGAGQGVTVSTLCRLIPPTMKNQTAASLLARMAELGWVAQHKPAGRQRGRLWRLTEAGDEIRSVYNRIAEDILRDVYDGASPAEQKTLLRLGEIASRFREQRLGPVVDRQVMGTEPADENKPNWAALRRAHFYISDLFYRVAEPMGVAAPQRRILDSLGFARSRGVERLAVSTICELIPLDTRAQTVTSILERMRAHGWVASAASTATDRRRGRTWCLEQPGDEIRAVYKRAAEDILRDVHDLATPAQRDTLLRLAASATAFRDSRLTPVLQLHHPEATALERLGGSRREF